jgi:threonyl-tRNA synthetase
MARHPYTVVIGEKEATTDTLSPRAREAGDLGSLPLAEFKARLLAEARPPRPRAG